MKIPSLLITLHMVCKGVRNFRKISAGDDQKILILQRRFYYRGVQFFQRGVREFFGKMKKFQDWGI